MLTRASFAPAPEAGRLRLRETHESLREAIVAPVSKGTLTLDGRPYRGLLEVLPGDDGALTVVNVVKLESYLRGVVPNELSPWIFPEIEALKAQAVAARSWVLAQRERTSSRDYDVCATSACQVYGGRSAEDPLADRAVEETEGIVATWKGRPIRAYYTSTCGGHTESGEAMLGDSAPYLQGVECPAGCAGSLRQGLPRSAGGVGGVGPRVTCLGEGDGGQRAAAWAARHDRWRARLDPAVVAHRVARYGRVGEIRALVPRKRGVSGRVVDLEVKGTDGRLRLWGLRVRRGLGLKENPISVRGVRDDEGDVKGFVLSGRGWGHGVGLCQVGAFEMAHQGADYEKILRHYYTGIELASVADLS